MISLDLRSLALVVAALAPVVLVSFLAETITSAAGVGVWLALVAAAVVCCLLCAHFYMRRLDEAAWAGQLVAWFWGGSLGAVIAVVAAAAPSPLNELIGGGVTAMIARMDDSPPFVPTDVAFGLGAAYVLLAQMVGFLVFWIGWWIAKR